MYQYFEAIRVENGEVMNLSYHQQRIERVAQLELRSIVKQLDIPTSGMYKLRVSYNESSFGEISITEYTPKPIQTLRVVESNDIEYATKRDDRTELNRLYEKRNKADEVIIVKRGLVTDTSYCNILFYDGNKWITPSTPLLRGTCRERLLREQAICEKEIKAIDIYKYQSFMLINAMLDFDIQRAIPINQTTILDLSKSR